MHAAHVEALASMPECAQVSIPDRVVEAVTKLRGIVAERVKPHLGMPTGELRDAVDGVLRGRVSATVVTNE